MALDKNKIMEAAEKLGLTIECDSQKPGISFSDGTYFTWDDVKVSLNRTKGAVYMFKFFADGVLTTRGEVVSSYAKGDEVQVLKEEGNVVQVIITTGESKGNVAYIDPNLIHQ